MNVQVRKAVDIVWNYLISDDEVGAADALIVLGSRDDRVAIYAAGLIKRFTYKTVVITGGLAHHNDLLRANWERSPRPSISCG